MKRTVLAFIFAIIFILSFTSCADREAQKPAEGENAQSGAVSGEEERGEDAPVTEPDENGSFPLISYEDWEKRSVADAEPNPEIPKEPIPSVTEYKDFKERLLEFYPEIDDWELIYEEGSYELTLSYDPDFCCFGEIYMPHKAAVLKTEQSESFDRLFVSVITRFWADDTGEGILLSEKHFYSFDEARESEINAGDFSGVKFYRSHFRNVDSAFFEDEQKQLVFDEEGKVFVILGADKYAEIIFNDKRSDMQYTYKMSEFRDSEWNLINVPESRKNDRIISVVTEKTKNALTTVFAYYEAETKTLTYFDMPPYTISSSEERKVCAIDGETLLFVCGPDIYFCDMSEGTNVTEPFAAFNTAENGLSENGSISVKSFSDGILYFSCPSADDKSKVMCSFDTNEHSLQKDLP